MRMNLHIFNHSSCSDFFSSSFSCANSPVAKVAAEAGRTLPTLISTPR